MKHISPLLILIILVVSCNKINRQTDVSQHDQVKSNEQKINSKFKGNVKSYVQNVYNASFFDGVVKELNKVDEVDGYTNCTAYYDTKNNCAKWIDFDHAGNKIRHSYLKLSYTDSLVTWIDSSFATGESDTTITKINSITKVFNDTVHSTHSYSIYNDEGNEIETVWLNEDKSMHSKTFRKFLNRKCIEEMCKYLDNGGIRSKETTYEYNSHNDLIKEINKYTYRDLPNSRDVNEYLFEYDNKGNWTSYTEIADNEVRFTVRRTFEYFDL